MLSNATMNPNFSSHQGKRYPLYYPINAKLQNEQHDSEYKRHGHNDSNKAAFETTFDSLSSSSQLQSGACFPHNQATSNFYEKSFPSALKLSRQNPTSLEDALKSEKSFLDYVMSLPNRESMYSHSDDYASVQVNNLTIHDISKASNTSGKDKLGFEYLDNLCKLMQQLGELREANVKLQRKVQYLEEVKPIHESSLLLSSDSHGRYNSNLELGERTGSYLTIAHVSKDESDDCDHLIEVNVPRSPRISKDRKSRMLKNKGRLQMSQEECIVRERSKSVCDIIVTNSERSELRESTKPPKRIPTWSKVKEALGFEKHHSSHLRSSSQVSLTNINSDQVGDMINKTGFKQIPKSISKSQLRPAYQFENNPNQFNDQILKSKSFSSGFKEYLKEESPCYDNNDYSRYDDLEMCLGYESEKNDKQLTQGPWNKVKTMIQTSKDTMRKKEKEKEKKQVRQVKSSLKFSHNHFKHPSIGGYEGIDDDDSINTNNANEWISTRTNAPYSLAQSRSLQFGSKVDHYTRTDHIPRANFLDIYEPLNSEDASTKPIINSASCSKFGKIKETPNSLGLRTSIMSPPVQRRSKWVKMKKVFANAGEGARPLEMVIRTDDLSSISSSDASNKDETPIETPSDKLRKNSNESSYSQTQAIISNSSNEPVTDKIQELQRNLSQDFNKKMAEWEKMRSLGGLERENENNLKKERKSSLPKLTKKRKSQRSMDKITKVKMKEVNWLERELSKIDKEKERLSKEHEKYEEKAKRLIKLKEAITQSEGTSDKKEVLIRTAAGEFRFEGISDDFTRKLYEWETKKGVCPESSTIALLNSSRRYSDLTRYEVDGNKSRKKRALELFTRSISRSESYLSNHSNQQTLTALRMFASLPSLKANEAANHQSLSNIANLDLVRYFSKDQLERKKSLVNSNESAVNESELKRSKDNSLNESSVDQMKSKSLSNPFAVADNSNQCDSCYQLLQSNVMLVENLKNKDSLCNQLENELKALDGKLQAMKNKHQVEMEHYRDKLWKLHVTGTKQDYLESFLKVINQLKDRINQVETCGQRLKLDKEHLEDDFRYHNDQQAKMTLELIQVTKKLQKFNFLASILKNVKDEARPNQRPVDKYDLKNVHILHDLSSQIFQQACELERALLDRSRSICQLQLELLTRDISIIKLQTELENIKCEQIILPLANKAATRRYKYGQKRSESENLHLSQLFKLYNTKDDNQKSVYSFLAFKDWFQTCYAQSELSKTTYRLKMELFKLSNQCDQKEEGSEGTDEPQLLSANDVQGFENLINVGPKMHHTNGDRSIHNISSDLENSENSSLNDCDQILYKPEQCWRQTKNASPSSKSWFIKEGHLVSSQWGYDDPNFKFKSPNFSSHDNQSNYVASQYTSDSRSSSDILNRQNSDPLDQLYDNQIFLKQYSSFPVLNKGFAEFSPISEQQLALSTKLTNLKAGNFQPFCCSKHDEYTGIPMIDDQLEVTSCNKKTRSDIDKHRAVVYMTSSAKPWTVEKAKEEYNKLEDICNTASKDAKPVTKETFLEPS